MDSHSSERGVFYGVIGGRTIGVFDVVYDPSRPEAELVGHIASAEKGIQFFQVWCSFRPRRKAKAVDRSYSISDYRLDTVIHPDLSMASQATFVYRASADDGRAIGLELSSHLRVTAAKIDGKPAEFIQHDFINLQPLQGGAPLLLVAAEPLAPEIPHNVELS